MSNQTWKVSENGFYETRPGHKVIYVFHNDDLALASAALALLALETHGIKFCVEHWQIANDGGDCPVCKAMNEI